VVAEPLEEARHQRHLHGDRQRHLPGGKLGEQARVQLVHLVVALVKHLCDGTVPSVPGIHRLAPHLGGDVVHPLDQPAGAWRKVLAENVIALGSDLHDQVVRAFEFGHDAQHREQEAQVIRDRGLKHDLADDQVLDLGIERVDGPLSLGQDLARLAAAGQQGLGRLGQVLRDEGEQLDDLRLDVLQLALELLSVPDHTDEPSGQLSGTPARSPQVGSVHLTDTN